VELHLRRRGGQLHHRVGDQLRQVTEARAGELGLYQALRRSFSVFVPFLGSLVITTREV
jgi:hypothetical protein